ncbi:hypothetical protein FRB98_005850 [Tulasnella sp. 332]|nr:hypothetical protein FRB98_005850 [Tulasnella sp. 332]
MAVLREIVPRIHLWKTLILNGANIESTQFEQIFRFDLPRLESFELHSNLRYTFSEVEKDDIRHLLSELRAHAPRLTDVALHSFFIPTESTLFTALRSLALEIGSRNDSSAFLSTIQIVGILVGSPQLHTLVLRGHVGRGLPVEDAQAEQAATAFGTIHLGALKILEMEEIGDEVISTLLGIIRAPLCTHTIIGYHARLTTGPIERFIAPQLAGAASVVGSRILISSETRGDTMKVITPNRVDAMLELALEAKDEGRGLLVEVISRLGLSTPISLTLDKEEERGEHVLNSDWVHSYLDGLTTVDELIVGSLRATTIRQAMFRLAATSSTDIMGRILDGPWCWPQLRSITITPGVGYDAQHLLEAVKARKLASGLTTSGDNYPAPVAITSVIIPASQMGTGVVAEINAIMGDEGQVRSLVEGEDKGRGEDGVKRTLLNVVETRYPGTKWLLYAL